MTVRLVDNNLVADSIGSNSSTQPLSEDQIQGLLAEALERLAATGADVSDVPEWMCELIGHLHAKDSDQRYSSAKEVSELLAQCTIDLQASRVPKVPDPSKAAEKPPEVDSEIRPRRVESLLHSPLGKVAAAVKIVLGVLGITEATGVTKLASTVIRRTTGSVTLVIESQDLRVKIAIDGKEVTICTGSDQHLGSSHGKACRRPRGTCREPVRSVVFARRPDAGFRRTRVVRADLGFSWPPQVTGHPFG